MQRTAGGRTSTGSACARALILFTAKAGIAVLPAFCLAGLGRASTRRAVRRGRKLLSRCSAPVRVLAGTAAPFSRLEVDIGGKPTYVEAVPWLTWFRSSIYSRVLSKADLLELSKRFSCKVRLRVIVLSGPPLPVASYPGVVSDAAGDALQWLIEKYM